MFAANTFPKLLQPNTFQIINASQTNHAGTHWMVLCHRHRRRPRRQRGVVVNGEIVFADPLGLKLRHAYPLVYKRLKKYYNKINQIVNKAIQSYDSNACGLYCIYLAHVIFSKRYPKIPIYIRVSYKEIYKTVRVMGLAATFCSLFFLKLHVIYNLLTPTLYF